MPVDADFKFQPEIAADIAVGLIRRGEVTFGDYKLRSGLWSPLYVDLRPTASAVEENPIAPGMSKADQLKFRKSVILGYSAMLELLEGEFEHIQAVPEAVCGLAPMVAYEADASYLHRRIKPKDYGKPSDGILGDFNQGDRTVFIDDLISSSGAKVDEKRLVEDISRSGGAGDEVRGAGLVVQHCLILLDRETGGIEAAAQEGLQVHAGLDITDVLEIGRAEGAISSSDYQIYQAYMSGELTTSEDKHKFA